MRRILVDHARGHQRVKRGQMPVRLSLDDVSLFAEDNSWAVVEQIGPDLELRRRLQETAAAITVYQKETIPFRELAIRLGFKPADLERFASDSTRNNILTELLINFFFKGGNQNLGCEFLHKSFREYLYAEYLIETLIGQ